MANKNEQWRVGLSFFSIQSAAAQFACLFASEKKTIFFSFVRFLLQKKNITIFLHFRFYVLCVCIVAISFFQVLLFCCIQQAWSVRLLAHRRYTYINDVIKPIEKWKEENQCFFFIKVFVQSKHSHFFL